MGLYDVCERTLETDNSCSFICIETSSSHDKAALIATLKAIDKELADQSVWNKSLS